MNIRFLNVLCIAFFLGVLKDQYSGQPVQTSTGPSFEVATVKPYKPDLNADSTYSGGICRGINTNVPAGLPYQAPLGRCVYHNYSLAGLLAATFQTQNAFATVDQLVSGGPAWIYSDSFDIEGKAEDEKATTQRDLLFMMRNLLINGFQIKYHLEPTRMPAFKLVVNKGGHKLKVGSGTMTGIMHRDGSISATNADMDTLARSLSRSVGRIVLNETGLMGGYAFEMDEGTYSLESRLGLSLVSTQIDWERMVIDDAVRLIP